jgi:hypothetical protein
VRVNGQERRRDATGLWASLGETFSYYVTQTSIPFEEADVSPHECCEVVWSVLGYDVTPTRLWKLNESQVAALANKFGEYFGYDSPTVEEVKDAIADTLARWPIDSLGESE